MKDNESIAGTHSEDILFIIDEASAIPDEIWDAIEREDFKWVTSVPLKEDRNSKILKDSLGKATCI